MGQPELRTLFEQLQLKITYHPGEQALDVVVSLWADAPQSAGTRQLTEDWSVPPAGFEPAAFRSGGERSIP